jgi:hypothetical protein
MVPTNAARNAVALSLIRRKVRKQLLPAERRMFEFPLNWGIWDDSLAIPVFCTALSASIFCLHATLSRLAWRSANDTRSTRRGHRFAFELTRVCGCVTLLLLSFIPDEQRGAVGAFEFHPRTIMIQTLLCFVYVSRSV